MSTESHSLAHKTQEEIVKRYGFTTQSIIWIEELAELQKALTKLLRVTRLDRLTTDAGQKAINDLHEEMADVLICLEQMIITFKNEKEVDKNYYTKMARMRNHLLEDKE